MDLRPSEIRVLGCLLEKQRTTPDLYPLTLNSLRLACNQSTNREPVVSYDDSEVRDALHRLERRGFTRFAGGAGSRAPKYRHLLAEALPMDEAEQATMCVMMLRGPQTPGELKQRCDRMHPFGDLAAVHETLERLIGRDLVVKLPRRPGQKEERYAHTLGGESAGAEASSARIALPGTRGAAAPATPAATGALPPGTGAPPAGTGAPPAGTGAPPAGTGAPPEEIEQLDARLSKLERELRELQARLGVGQT